MCLSCWIGLCMHPLSVFGQDEFYHFSRLNTYNGLSHNQVNAILKDDEGFLWFGTMSGLDRYDGYSFKIYHKRPNDSSSLADNSILSLFELPNGKMWVTTRAGACIYNSQTQKFDADYSKYLHSLGLPSAPVNKIVKGNNGRYWFLFENLDLYMYSEKDKTLRLFKHNPPFNPGSKIASIEETMDGKLWMVYQNGFLQEYNIEADKIIFSATTLQKLNRGNIPYSLLIDKDGDLWLWYYINGVFLFHPQDSSVRRFNENSYPCSLKSNLVSQVIQDKNGLIWIGTDQGGVTLIDKKNTFKTSYLLNDPEDPKSLSQNSITTIYKDDIGIIWLGTYKQGINYLNSNIVQFPHYHHQESNPNSLPYDDINQFVEDKSGNIWIGTNGGGLIYFDRKKNTFKQYLHDTNNKNSLSNNVIVSLCIDNEKILWIGTYLGGLNSFDGKKFKHYRHADTDSASLANDNVWKIFEDREQNLWIGTLGGGLDLLNRKTGGFTHYGNEQGKSAILPSNYISDIMQDRNGNLWIGTDNGIAVLKENSNRKGFYTYSKDKNRLSNNNVICISEDRKGRIWVGTAEGLDLFNDQAKDFQTFAVTDGLPDNMILNILEGGNQSLWISTPNGLCNAIPAQKENSIGLSVISYDELNNLQNQEFNSKAAYKTRDGKMIFGGPSGFNIIDPSIIKKPVYHSKIVFTDLEILNKKIEPGELVNNRVLLHQSLSQLQGIDLKYKENVFSIEFASLDYGNSTRDKYAYMLEGFNPDWLYADGNQRSATYTNLDPGHYTFKVKVLNSEGLWSDTKELRIDIDPPFWRTPIAYIIYILIVGSLLILIRRITLDRIHMRYEVAHRREEAERAHALERLKTKFFTNVSHEFRTPLSLIIAPLEKIIKQTEDEEQKKQLNLVQRNAKRLLSLVNQLLDFRKMEVQEVKLHPSIGDIITFSKDISNSFLDIAEKKNIRLSYTSNIERLEVYFDKDKIEKILFNLLSNAFKYTEENGMVSINLTYNPPVINESDGTLAIEVRDTGIGIQADMHEKIFERFFQTDVPESMVNQGTGIGLAITKAFVRLHNGVITVKSEPEHGSCFTVLLPAKKIYDYASVTATNPIPEEAEQIISETSHRSGKKKTILVVEDSEDLRFYLKDNLKGQYKVEEATNGKEGWEKIKLLNPDLVVSDIMMPLMDGVELVRKIKAETLTAHIPVILLTAVGSEEKQLAGFKAGINDYITKPFTFEILDSRIRNLLAQQELLHKRFQKQIEVNPGEVTITPVDEKFLKQALEIVEKNLDVPEFSVEDFSRDMFMNRVTLYRKIVSVTGRTPIEFIRSIRLKRAAQLLEKSGLTIAEIAYEVGFNNPKNFTKFFKEEFKMLPSKYASKKKEIGS
jgi:signal transduction histidine kinase/ligand-binding sensor domain-containing protein/DNA-binding response OmpR family regulator